MFNDWLNKWIELNWYHLLWLDSIWFQYCSCSLHDSDSMLYKWPLMISGKSLRDAMHYSVWIATCTSKMISYEPQIIFWLLFINETKTVGRNTEMTWIIEAHFIVATHIEPSSMLLALDLLWKGVPRSQDKWAPPPISFRVRIFSLQLTSVSAAYPGAPSFTPILVPSQKLWGLFTPAFDLSHNLYTLFCYNLIKLK